MSKRGDHLFSGIKMTPLYEQAGVKAEKISIISFYEEIISEMTFSYNNLYDMVINLKNKINDLETATEEHGFINGGKDYFYLRNKSNITWNMINRGSNFYHTDTVNNILCNNLHRCDKTKVGKEKQVVCEEKEGYFSQEELSIDNPTFGYNELELETSGGESDRIRNVEYRAYPFSEERQSSQIPQKLKQLKNVKESEDKERELPLKENLKEDDNVRNEKVRGNDTESSSEMFADLNFSDNSIDSSKIGVFNLLKKNKVVPKILYKKKRDYENVVWKNACEAKGVDSSGLPSSPNPPSPPSPPNPIIFPILPSPSDFQKNFPLLTEWHYSKYGKGGGEEEKKDNTGGGVVLPPSNTPLISYIQKEDLHKNGKKNTNIYNEQVNKFTAEHLGKKKSFPKLEEKKKKKNTENCLLSKNNKMLNICHYCGNGEDITFLYRKKNKDLSKIFSKDSLVDTLNGLDHLRKKNYLLKKGLSLTNAGEIRNSKDEGSIDRGTPFIHGLEEDYKGANSLGMSNKEKCFLWNIPFCRYRMEGGDNENFCNYIGNDNETNIQESISFLGERLYNIANGSSETFLNNNSFEYLQDRGVNNILGVNYGKDYSGERRREEKSLSMFDTGENNCSTVLRKHLSGEKLTGERTNRHVLTGASLDFLRTPAYTRGKGEGTNCKVAAYKYEYDNLYKIVNYKNVLTNLLSSNYIDIDTNPSLLPYSRTDGFFKDMDQIGETRTSKMRKKEMRAEMKAQRKAKRKAQRKARRKVRRKVRRNKRREQRRKRKEKRGKEKQQEAQNIAGRRGDFLQTTASSANSPECSYNSSSVESSCESEAHAKTLRGEDGFNSAEKKGGRSTPAKSSADNAVDTGSIACNVGVTIEDGKREKNGLTKKGVPQTGNIKEGRDKKGVTKSGLVQTIEQTKEKEKEKEKEKAKVKTKVTAKVKTKVKAKVKTKVKAKVKAKAKTNEQSAGTGKRYLPLRSKTRNMQRYHESNSSTLYVEDVRNSHIPAYDNQMTLTGRNDECDDFTLKSSHIKKYELRTKRRITYVLPPINKKLRRDSSRQIFDPFMYNNTWKIKKT
ncbi:conserved Plasmodium protein, unknown function [Plasmodium ovale wallikeri]|uniref:Uncharacterized protein n=1 Tax=Plasmodium ovale wallikeri TaxID=864142 RepID=A0A1A8YKH7_PLAOA|nr:conserved Plasmodium protein, unknown function [Plasmodium ovale wallikeri]